MAYEGFQVVAPGIIADADLSTSQYCAVSLSTENTVGLATSTVAVPFGILQNKPSAAGQAAEVCIFGITKVKLGGTVTYGQMIHNSSLGTIIAFDPALTSSNSLAYGFGQAIDGGASTQLGTAFINCATPMYYRATV
ncbi:MAG: hypothetical protein PHC43_01090 [Candidatus Marinimicrobia bacterium]|nr:hypothetical protein [Candidatus Neomarinimicrobiota bacterium]